MNARAEFIPGKSNSKEWAGVYGYRPDNHHEYFELGEIFSVIRVATPVDGFALENFAKLLLNELQENYYSAETNNSYDSILERFENSFWKMKAKMDQILMREDEVLDQGIDFEMVTIVIVEGVLYAAVIGESKLFILREDNFVDVSEALIDNRMSGFIKTGSLELQEDDRMLLSTSKSKISELSKLEEVAKNLNIGLIEDLDSVPGASVLLIADESLNWTESEEEEIEDNDVIVDDKEIDELEEPEDKKEEGEVVSPRFQNEETEDLTIPVETASLFARLKSKSTTLFASTKERSQELFSKAKGKAKDIKIFNRKKSAEDLIEDESDDDSVGSTSLISSSTALSKSKNLGQGAAKIAGSAVNRVKDHFQNNQTTYAELTNRFISGIKSVYNKIKELFSREIVGTNTRRYATNQHKRIKRNRIILAIAVIIISFFIYRNIQSARKNAAEEKVIAANKGKIDGFKSELSTLDAEVDRTKSLGVTEKENLITSFETLKTKVTSYKSSTDMFEQDADSILSQIATNEDEILLVSAVTTPQLINDIGAQFQDSTPYDMEYSQGFLFISDNTRNVVYRLPTELNSVLEVHATGFLNPTILTRNVAGDIVFFDSNTITSIGEFSPTAKDSVKRYDNTPIGEVGKVQEAAVFNGNDALYEIHQSNSQIYKREKEGAGYKNGGSLFNPDNPPNWKNATELSRAVDISVPFELYALIQGQGLAKYFSGGDNTLSYESYKNLLKSDFDKMAQGSAIDVSDNFLVIGIPTERKIMLFSFDNSNDERPLTLVKQYVFRGDQSTSIFKTLNELIINESERKIYVLDGGKVIRLDL